MKTLLFLVLVVCVAAQPFHVPNVTDMRCPYAEPLSQAIYIAEGGPNTHYPYGVKSIKTRGQDHARMITLESIHLNWRRWTRAGRPGGDNPDAFVVHMAARWCPVVSDPVGHSNWVRNVRILLAREMRLTSRQ
jgi:hypothetical protein